MSTTSFTRPYEDRERSYYSLNWAVGVVGNLRDKYPRATEFLRETLALSYRNLASICATRPTPWRMLREMVKSADSWYSKCFAGGGYRSWDEFWVTHVEDWLQMWAVKAPGGLGEYLTLRKNQIHCTSRVKGEAPED